MNHAIPGVNAGYITRHKLLEDHLRGQQQAISKSVFASLGDLCNDPGIRAWLGRGAARRAMENISKDECESSAHFGLSTKGRLEHFAVGKSCGSTD
jgi:hypothetical protein